MKFAYTCQFILNLGAAYLLSVFGNVRIICLELELTPIRLIIILQIDGHPFKSWYENHYGTVVGIKKGKKAPPKTEENVRESAPAARAWIGLGQCCRENRVADVLGRQKPWGIMVHDTLENGY